ISITDNDARDSGLSADQAAYQLDGRTLAGPDLPGITHHLVRVPDETGGIISAEISFRRVVEMVACRDPVVCPHGSSGGRVAVNESDVARGEFLWCVSY